MTTPTIVAVLIGKRLAGMLDLSDSQPVFRYDRDYRRLSTVPLSIMFPLAAGGASGEPLRNWLEGILPDHPDTLDALCQQHGIPSPEAIRLLVTPMGADCAGAVQFCPLDKVAALQSDTGTQEAIDDAAIADWLAQIRTDPVRRAYRADSTDTGFSIAGMQPKVALRRTESGWAVPDGSLPTTHLIKASRDELWPHEAVIEHLTMRTAVGCGIPAARTEVANFAGQEVIIVERFDRDTTGTVRLHQEDMCQALGHPPHHKYQRNSGPGPEDIASLLRNADPDRAEENLNRFLDILLFQWITASTDGHAKNVGILHPADGSVRLAPLYDACSWLPYRRGQFEKKIQLSMKIGTDYSLSTADKPEALRRTANRLGIDPLHTARRAAEIAAAIPDALESAIRSLPNTPEAADQIATLRRELPDRAARCHAIATTTAHTPANSLSQQPGPA